MMDNNTILLGHPYAKCYFCGTMTYITRVSTLRGMDWYVYEQHFTGTGGILGVRAAEIGAHAQEILDNGLGHEL